MYGADLTLAYVFSVLEGEFEDSFRSGFSDELYGLDDSVDNDVFNAGVFSLGVFSD